MSITNFTLPNYANGNTINADDLNPVLASIRSIFDLLIDANTKTPLLPPSFSGINQLAAVANNTFFYIDDSGNVTLLPRQALDDLVAASATSASASAASAATAFNAPGTAATSASSLAIGGGSKSFVLAQTGKVFSVNQWVSISDSSAPASRWMLGAITAFNTATGDMTVSVASSQGAGTYSSWSIVGAAPVATQGALALPITVSGTYQAMSSGGDYVFTNIAAQSAGALPSSPAAGDEVLFDNATTRYDLTIQRNGKLFMGLAEDHTVTRQGAFRVRFISDAIGWRFR